MSNVDVEFWIGLNAPACTHFYGLTAVLNTGFPMYMLTHVKVYHGNTYYY